MSLVRGVAGPKGRRSEGSLVRRVVGPKKVVGPKMYMGRWSEVSGKTWFIKLSSNLSNDKKRTRVVGPKDCPKDKKTNMQGK